MRYSKLLISALLMSWSMSASGFSENTTTQPVVVELFTSQGCSSCPPADELLRDIARNSSILALSLHVHYWDTLGWKDPYSSEANTNRQRVYSNHLGDGTVFTPEAVINGSYGVVGSNSNEVRSTIEKARKEEVLVPVILKWDEERHVVSLHVGTVSNAVGDVGAHIIAMKFKRNATTNVSAGENNGRILRSVNNVTQIGLIGEWNNHANDYEIPFTVSDDEGIAVIVQSGDQGKIIGAGSL